MLTESSCKDRRAAPFSGCEKGYLVLGGTQSVQIETHTVFPAPPEIRCYLPLPPQFLTHSLLFFSPPALLVTSAIFRGHANITCNIWARLSMLLRHRHNVDYVHVNIVNQLSQLLTLNMKLLTFCEFKMRHGQGLSSSLQPLRMRAPFAPTFNLYSTR